VALLTPLFAVLAGWISGWVASKIPGANLDRNQLVAFKIAATTAVVAAAHKWLDGWQHHEQGVSDGKAAPIKAADRGG
jgi:hypothetical protein